MADNDIITTSRAAKLLGISVRTAQLLIEKGALASWKTPGGHRRVAKSDVLAFKAAAPAATVALSARVVVVASEPRLPMLEKCIAAVAGCTVDAYSDAYAASLAIGARAPLAIVVDHAAGLPGVSLLQACAANAALNQTRLVAIKDRSSDPPSTTTWQDRIEVAGLDELADLLGSALRREIEQAGAAAEPYPFPVAENEAQRLKAFERTGLLVSPADPIFDQVTWLASFSLKAPIALVTLLSSTHQHFKSRIGLEMTETPRSWAFCNYTILQRDMFSVGDLAGDERFATNPAVSGAPHFRFYAGAPILDADGFAVGSLCVIDYHPRALDSEQSKALNALANLLSSVVQSRAAGADRH